MCVLCVCLSVVVAGSGGGGIEIQDKRSSLDQNDLA